MYTSFEVGESEVERGCVERGKGKMFALAQSVAKFVEDSISDPVTHTRILTTLCVETKLPRVCVWCG